MVRLISVCLSKRARLTRERVSRTRLPHAHCRLINSCTVKNPSQSAFSNIVQRAKETNKPVVVAGCVPQGDRKLKGLEDVSIVGVQQIDRVVEVVEETLKGHKVRLLAKKQLPLLDLPKIRKNPLVEIIPLSTGCLGACTYCKTRHARGKLGSYALDAIVGRAKQVIKEGVTEIWLSSEDTGAYGLDIGLDVTVLFKSLIRVLPPVRARVLCRTSSAKGEGACQGAHMLAPFVVFCLSWC